MDSSARSMLLTVLGDVVLPSGGQVWLQALTTGAGALDISPDATRQALRRLANQGIVTASHEGRNARYELTESGRRRLADAAERIYLRRPLVWDGRWHMLTYTFAERERATRDALRRELEWLGFGSLGAGVWVCPWDLGVRLQEVLDKHRIAGSVEVFTAVHDGEDRHLAARAYPLDDLQTAHAGFVRHVRAAGPVPDDPRQAFADRIRLVHDWRKFLFLDPGLPEELLPDGWLGADAAGVFVERYRALEDPSWQWWDEVVAATDPDGAVPGHPPSNLVGTRVAAPPPSASAVSPVDELPAQDDASSRRSGDPDAARTEEFLERLHAGTKVEPDDWMPDTYRQLNLKFIEMHANSEIMGALPEREWIARAPTLRRKRSLAAKVQDEVGHGQLIYRVAESLGKPRQQMYEDLVMGRSKFHNVFHYPTYTWGDVACIGFLVDGAAIVTQRALLNTSYAPYVRVMKRVVAEESLHYRHGEDIMLTLAAGTDEQFEMLQEAVNRWWEPVMHFFGTDIAAEDDPMIHWGVKTQTNEESRQAWMSQYVPKMWDMGIEVPDTTLRWDAGKERWSYEEPDWDRLMAIVKGDPTPATATRLYWRQLMHEHHDWVRDIILGEDAGFVTAA